MNAAEIMTRKVVTIPPTMHARDIARLLAEHRISAVPVVNRSGAVVGIVSEGDLVRRSGIARDEQASWWLDMLAQGEALAPEFVRYARSGGKLASDLMSRDLVSVGEATPITEIAGLFERHRIKRVPVLDANQRLVGIVSRADLVRAIAHDREGRWFHPPG
jgi:CBS domain-containing protein